MDKSFLRLANDDDKFTCTMLNFFADTKLLRLLSALIIIILAVSSYTRNAVWRDEVSLYANVTRISHHKTRAHFNMALACEKAERLNEAHHYFEKTLLLDPGYEMAHEHEGYIYYREGDFAKAIYHLGYLLTFAGSIDTLQDYNRIRSWCSSSWGLTWIITSPTLVN